MRYINNIIPLFVLITVSSSFADPVHNTRNHDRKKWIDLGTDKIESYRVTGKRNQPPLGYQDTSSVEITHGPDPDDTSAERKDPITGTDLTKFGSAYMDSNPVKTGKPGDATGNVASRDNFSH